MNADDVVEVRGQIEMGLPSVVLSVNGQSVSLDPGDALAISQSLAMAAVCVEQGHGIGQALIDAGCAPHVVEMVLSAAAIANPYTSGQVPE